MSLEQKIMTELKAAMLAKDEASLRSLRAVKAAILLAKTSEGGGGELKEEDEIKLLQKLVKQRKDSIEQYEKANRMELAAAEKNELAVLEGYLPQMMSKDEVTQIAIAKKNEMGLSDKGQSGILMAALMKDLRGKADGAVVKEVVTHLLG